LSTTTPGSADSPGGCSRRAASGLVGEADDGSTALAAVAALQPELVLLDILLPDTNGFDVAERLAERPERPAVVLTSSREAADFGRRLERSPVNGFIHKDDLSGIAIAQLVGGSP
jgi:CheY-like chemotaxis protein